MFNNITYFIVITTILNLIPFIIKIKENKIKQGVINFINSSVCTYVILFSLSCIHHYNTLYNTMLFAFIVFQIFFVYNILKN